MAYLPRDPLYMQGNIKYKLTILNTLKTKSNLSLFINLSISNFVPNSIWLQYISSVVFYGQSHQNSREMIRVIDSSLELPSFSLKTD